jgi:prevent-host-death family protein
MREISVWEASQNFSQVIAAAERGETIVVTKNGRPVAKITPNQETAPAIPNGAPNFAALRRSLRSKRGSGFRVGSITEDDKYG